jgi:nitroreductase
MFMDLITKRRSIRRFADRPVERDKIEQLVEAALRAPSGRDLRPWEFVVVTDKALIGRLASSKPHGAAFVRNAPLAVVVCVDPQKSDVWIEDASIATIFLQLAATDLGLGSCWVQMRLRNHEDGRGAGDYVAEVLGLRPGLTALAIMAIGYPDEQKAPRAKSDLPYDKVSYR